MPGNTQENGTLIVRADATEAIGAGHIMRCAALSQGFLDVGGKVTFVTKCDSPDLSRKILSSGFSIIPVERPWPDPLDLEQTIRVLEKAVDSEGFAPWLLLDGYNFDSSYQKTISEKGGLLAVIDDMGHLPFYHADILVNQNVYAQKVPYSHKKETLLLLGAAYALLRREFLDWRGWQRDIPESTGKILVTMGGSDSKDATAMVIDALAHLTNPGTEVKIVVGPSNMRGEEYRQKISSLPCTAEVLTSPDNMPELMAWADLAISAGGTTCMEMCFMGLPNLVTVLSENQRPVAEELDRRGCSVNLGRIEALTPDTLLVSLMRVIQDREARERMSEAGRSLVDGLGVKRVLEGVRKHAYPEGPKA